MPFDAHGDGVREPRGLSPSKLPRIESNETARRNCDPPSPLLCDTFEMFSVSVLPFTFDAVLDKILFKDVSTFTGRVNPLAFDLFRRSGRDFRLDGAKLPSL